MGKGGHAGSGWCRGGDDGAEGPPRFGGRACNNCHPLVAVISTPVTSVFSDARNRRRRDVRFSSFVSPLFGGRPRFLDKMAEEVEEVEEATRVTSISRPQPSAPSRCRPTRPTNIEGFINAISQPALTFLAQSVVYDRVNNPERLRHAIDNAGESLLSWQVAF